LFSEGRTIDQRLGGFESGLIGFVFLVMLLKPKNLAALFRPGEISFSSDFGVEARRGG
jgi:hypothetical protein